MYQARFAPSGRNEAIVQVYDYQDKCPRGTLSGFGFSQPVSFSGLMQLLISMEDLMDLNNSPQRGEERRVFQPGKAAFPTANPLASKPLAIFRINVLFRQHASWQGTLIWTDRAMDAQFRSVLELVRLMDSALTTQLE